MEQRFVCWNGPKQDALVGAPMDASVGTACALPWQTPEGKSRFAVYVLTEHAGRKGLLYLKSYESAQRAADRVTQITATMLRDVA